MSNDDWAKDEISRRVEQNIELCEEIGALKVEIKRLEAALSDMHLAYNNCANNADALRDERDEARRHLFTLRRAHWEPSVNDADVQGSLHE